MELKVADEGLVFDSTDFMGLRLALSFNFSSEQQERERTEDWCLTLRLADDLLPLSLSYSFFVSDLK